MEKHYKEKYLQATIYKIENVKRQQNFLLQHIWKVIGFGIVFSFWAPTYRPERPFRQHGSSMTDKTEYSYTQLVLLCAIVFIVLCLLYHFSSKFQDKRKLKNLTALKTKLEKEIAALEN